MPREPDMRFRVAQQIFVGDDETPSAGRVSRKLQVVVQPQQVGLSGAGDGGGCGVGFVGPAREGSEHGARPAQHLHHHHPFEARRELRQPERRQAGNSWILEQQGSVRRLPPSEPFPDSHAGPGCLRVREAFLRQWCGVVPGSAQRAKKAVVDGDDVADRCIPATTTQADAFVVNGRYRKSPAWTVEDLASGSVADQEPAHRLHATVPFAQVGQERKGRSAIALPRHLGILGKACAEVPVM